MPGAGPAAAEGRQAPTAASNLLLRVVSSLVLVPLALATAYWGGWPFNLLWSIASFAILCEWLFLVRHERRPGPRAVWMLGGIAYAGGILAATAFLRADATHGLAAILFLFAVVWGTDIAAYFAGRAIGGPKLMPRVSPKKTWSGAIGGTLAAIIAGVAVARLFGIGGLVPVAVLALVLSVASQAGDLLESALKRRFDAKDSGSLLPGHGGVMDRLDGYATAVFAAGLIGLTHGGWAAPARGLLVW